MSQENVEIVRRWHEHLNRWLDAYWADPGPLEESPLIGEVFDGLDSEVEWDWVFTPETFQGREQLLQAVADWVDAVDSWRLEIEELIDAGGDRVFSAARVYARGKGSGAPIDQRVFTAFTVRDGKIARMDDYTERAEALKAAGLSE